MTKLTKKVARETGATVFERKVRPVIVSFEPPDLIGFRLKGTRRTYFLPAGSCYYMAVKGTVAAERAAKLAAKKKGKKGK